MLKLLRLLKSGRIVKLRRVIPQRADLFFDAPLHKRDAKFALANTIHLRYRQALQFGGSVHISFQLRQADQRTARRGDELRQLFAEPRELLREAMQLAERIAFQERLDDALVETLAGIG